MFTPWVRFSPVTRGSTFRLHGANRNMTLEQGNNHFIDTGSHYAYPLGPVLMTTQAEMHKQLLGVTRTATLQVSIWSSALQGGVFEHAGFLEVLKRFILARRQARVRLLLSEAPDPYLQPRHPLIMLAERLPGTFDVRAVEQATLEAAELIISDETAVLYRIHADRWDGVSNIRDPQVARFYLAQFNTSWRTALPVIPFSHSVGL